MRLFYHDHRESSSERFFLYLICYVLVGGTTTLQKRCPPPAGLDRNLRGLSGLSSRSVLIKICANKKIGESAKGVKNSILKGEVRSLPEDEKDAEIPPRSKKEDQSVSVDHVFRW